MTVDVLLGKDLITRLPISLGSLLYLFVSVCVFLAGQKPISFSEITNKCLIDIIQFWQHTDDVRELAVWALFILDIMEILAPYFSWYTIIIITILIIKYIYYSSLHSKALYNKTFYAKRYKENIIDFEKQSQKGVSSEET